MAAPQPYGDLVALNTGGPILEAVGRETLEAIVSDYLENLGTSAAVYEKNGDYASGIFTSGWCRALDARSRELCRTDDNRAALASGLWHCHESCWTEASKTAMDRGAPVDVPCRGGIRLYAVPIFARGEVIGSINFGYGTPPGDASALAEVAARYDVPVERLTALAHAYTPRRDDVVEAAKRHLATTARLVGALVERRIAERERDTSEQLYEALADERRRLRVSLDEKDVLLKEVHHRVKNNLQIVTSLLELQSRLVADAPAREVLRESQSRVRSIALVHERIYRASDLSSIDFDAYLQSLAKSLLVLYDAPGRGISIQACSADVHLGIDTAMPCGLIVNELVSNAFKHAFPAGRGGRVEVTLRHDGDALRLCVKDDGVGFPEGFDVQRSPSLGLSLVRSLTDQLGGSLAMDRSGGTIVTVRFPAAPPSG